MNFFKKISVLFLAAGVLFSCSEEKLDPESILVDLDIEQNELDSYIQKQFTDDYNISIVYKFVEPESDYDYNLSPANYESAVRITKLLHYLGIEPYDRIVGNKDFIRAYFPKLLNYIGSPAYRNNGTMVLGTAEGGVKITMYALNQLTEERSTNVAFLNRYYFHTMHHEFAHILHQNKDYPASFREITGSGYVGDSWNDIYDDEGAAAEGFISAYASKEANEDFVETYSYYITLTPAQWEERISSGSEEGRAIIEEKLDIVRAYFETVWNIDLNVLRDEILLRQEALPDFDQLSLN
ncbi:zinc-binding metallopeptidase [Sphingobacterium gobiense]|uniref:Substrate import-associated zinc metallohydrolase lipoprotein n=1 Tax=Sphingobacterium gobiense TaxID=1382456 RepID=A0A2S9JMB8_9SPHI|nr:putative zinc-binding metallopeptidase [Sphingobacterium gobiense]PRD54258.1 hypothetical protein C5749_12340 [Sphingobacterium gobiense]